MSEEPSLAELWHLARSLHRRRSERGHTLIEVLVTIAIIVVIAALVATALWKLYKFVRSFAGGPMSSVG